MLSLKETVTKLKIKLHQISAVLRHRRQMSQYLAGQRKRGPLEQKGTKRKRENRTYLLSNRISMLVRRNTRSTNEVNQLLELAMHSGTELWLVCRTLSNFCHAGHAKKKYEIGLQHCIIVFRTNVEPV